MLDLLLVIAQSNIVLTEILGLMANIWSFFGLDILRTNDSLVPGTFGMNFNH